MEVVCFLQVVEKVEARHCKAELLLIIQLKVDSLFPVTGNVYRL